MTRAEWDTVLSGDYLGKHIESGDEITVVYRCNWHRGRAYKKADPHHTGKVLFIDERGIKFERGKRLSYKSIYDLSFHSWEDDLPDCIAYQEWGTGDIYYMDH
jgi:hypothetical protein